MGADLYIKKMDRQAQYRGFEVSDDAVDAGYFRDCYNPGGLFFLMSYNLGKRFSYWQTAGRKELFRKDGDMSIKGVKIWLEELRPELEAFKNLPQLYYKDSFNPGQENDPDIKRDKDGFLYKRVPLTEEEMRDTKEHADLLLKFLELAVAEKSPIIWSV